MDQTQAVTQQVVGDLVKAAFGGNPGVFRPCAFFDEPLDCIRLLTRDCSFTEWRVSPTLTVLEDNYPKEGVEPYVGFTIKGVKHFCKQHGIDLAVPVKLTEILDKMLAESTEAQVRMAVQAIARPLVQQEPELDEVSLTTA